MLSHLLLIAKQLSYSNNLTSKLATKISLLYANLYLSRTFPNYFCNALNVSVLYIYF